MVTFTLVDPRQWHWTSEAAYRIDLIRHYEDGSIATEEYIASGDNLNVESVIAEARSHLGQNDTLELYAVAADPDGNQGLLRLL